MAELGLIASVFQIASCGLKLSITLYTFAETVSAADKNIKHIAKDVSLTSAVLNELGTSLVSEKQRMVTSDNAIKTAEEVVHECSQVFTEIEATLQKGMKKAGSGKPGLGRLGLEKLKWPFLQPKMELLRSNLERLKSTLILLLNVLAYAHKVNQATSSAAERDFDRQQIESLIIANRQAVEKFEEMRRAIKDGEIPKTPGRGLEDPGCNSFGTSSPLLGSFSILPAQGIPVRQPTPDAIEAPAMSWMHPTALVNCMRKLGYLVDRLEDARSIITATKLVPEQPNLSHFDEPRKSSAAIVENDYAYQPAEETNEAKKNNAFEKVEPEKVRGQHEATQENILASAKRLEMLSMDPRTTNHTLWYARVASSGDESASKVPIVSVEQIVANAQREYPFKEDSDQDDDKHLHRSDINPPGSQEDFEFGEDAPEAVLHYLRESLNGVPYLCFDEPRIEADQNQDPAELHREVSELLKAWTKIRD